MIRFTIQRKLFMASFVLATVVAALLLGLTRWNLQQGFGRYIVETEMGQLDWLVKNVEGAYAQNGSWAFLQGSGEAMRRLLGPPPRPGGRRLPPVGEAPIDGPPEPSDQPDGFAGPPGRDDAPDFPGPPNFADRPPPFADGPPPLYPPGPPGGGRGGDPLGIHPRLSVHDISGKVLAGNPRPDGLSVSRPIRYRGQTVGTLVLFAPETGATRDAAFLASQTRHLWLSGLAVLFLSLAAAWLLARQFVGPIKALATGARHIAEGQFGARIPVRRSDELGELAQDFNAMAEMLARTEEFRRQWVSDSSHELRTPIAVLRAEIEAMQDGVRNADEKTLTRLLKHVMQMGKLVDDLRQTLDRDNGQADLERRSMHPLTVLRESLDEFRPRLAMADLTLDTTDLPQTDPGWRIQGDAQRLEQVFANLLENTLRYTNPGGRLKVAASARAGRLHLQFDDTSPAPPEHAMHRLFERFFRAEPSRSREHGGSGLGLAISKTIITGHGGTITAGASALGGLCIRIVLPLEH